MWNPLAFFGCCILHLIYAVLNLYISREANLIPILGSWLFSVSVTEMGELLMTSTVLANYHNCKPFLQPVEVWHQIIFLTVYLPCSTNLLLSYFIFTPVFGQRSCSYCFTSFSKSGSVSEGPVCDFTWTQTCSKSSLCSWFDLSEVQRATLPFWYFG